MFMSSRDESRLHRVNYKLVEVIREAYRISPMQLMIIEGVRTKEKQMQYVKTGASRTMNSRHLTGNAVDIGVMEDGQLSWQWPYYYQLASTMKRAAISKGVELVWGGVWDKNLNNFTKSPEEEVALYAARFRKKNPGRAPLLDGPHYEIANPEEIFV